METQQVQSDKVMGGAEHARWLSEGEVARITGMSVAWLQRKRWSGGGIPFAKLGRAVRYKLSDVLDWVEERKRISTSAGNGDGASRG